MADARIGRDDGAAPGQSTLDLFGTRIGGTRRASPFLDSQHTGEVFYRFHVTPNFAITPEFQLQMHASFNPSANAPRVFSLWARLVV